MEREAAQLFAERVSRLPSTAPSRARSAIACRAGSGAGGSNQSKASGSPPRPGRRGRAGQVHAADLRLALRPQTIAGVPQTQHRPGPVRPARPARCSAESAPMRSVSRRSRPCPGRSGARVEPGVHHRGDALDGERGLGDVGGQDDLAVAAGRPGRVLLVGRQRAVERQHPHPALAAADAGGGESGGEARIPPSRAESTGRRRSLRARRGARPRPVHAGCVPMLTGWRGPAVDDGQPPRKSATGPAASVADITTTSRSARAATPRDSARARSASRLRSWNSSRTTVRKPPSSGSDWRRAVRMPSVATRSRVAAESGARSAPASRPRARASSPARRRSGGPARARPAAAAGAG